VKGATEAGIAVIPIPGVSALTTLLSIGGLPTDRFVFEGFLPSKSTQRRKTLEHLKHEERTLVFFESPHRIVETLTDIENIFGDREVVLGRELTKLFEEVLRGRVREILAQLQDRDVKGEIVLLIAGCGDKKETLTGPAIEEEIRHLAAEGLSLKEIAQIVSQQHGIPKREVYALGVRLRGESKI
jgi:16S rRNA (cytidine1402-2'-O)-methyltransferase